MPQPARQKIFFTLFVVRKCPNGVSWHAICNIFGRMRVGGPNQKRVEKFWLSEKSPYLAFI